MSDEPFGRQPQPVTVTISGDRRDVIRWVRALMQRAEAAGDMAQEIGHGTFKIYPRAVND